MGKAREDIDPALQKFIESQHMFFVASSPLAGGGHINLSPKGLDTFRILDPKRVAYLDYTGSGVETIAHVRENGRLTIMFCAFKGSPDIVRLYGKGSVVERGDPEFAAMVERFEPVAGEPGVRAIVVLDLTRVTSSCGFGVPLYEYVGEREKLIEWADRKGLDGIRTYQDKNNLVSIDGLPGLRSTGRAE